MRIRSYALLTVFLTACVIILFAGSADKKPLNSVENSTAENLARLFYDFDTMRLRSDLFSGWSCGNATGCSPERPIVAAAGHIWVASGLAQLLRVNRVIQNLDRDAILKDLGEMLSVALEKYYGPRTFAFSEDGVIVSFPQLLDIYSSISGESDEIDASLSELLAVGLVEAALSSDVFESKTLETSVSQRIPVRDMTASIYARGMARMLAWIDSSEAENVVGAQTSIFEIDRVRDGLEIASSWSTSLKLEVLKKLIQENSDAYFNRLEEIKLRDSSVLQPVPYKNICWTAVAEFERNLKISRSLAITEFMESIEPVVYIDPRSAIEKYQLTTQDIMPCIEQLSGIVVFDGVAVSKLRVMVENFVLPYVASDSALPGGLFTVPGAASVPSNLLALSTSVQALTVIVNWDEVQFQDRQAQVN